MPYRVLAEAVLLVHIAFVLFVVLGGLLVLRWRRLAWAHVPAVLWGILIEWGGGECPLTPLESWLWLQAGAEPYAHGIIARCLLPVLYPAQLTREVQVALGALVLVVNLLVYSQTARGDPSPRW